MVIEVKFDQIDPNAKADSMPSSPDRQPWANMLDLKRDDLTPLNAMTLEHNQAILDGSMPEFPADPYLNSWGWWSKSISDSNGIFETPPILDIVFDRTHKSLGMTLFFLGLDWVTDVRIEWYASDLETVLKSGTYHLGSQTATIQEPVAGCKRIQIEFRKTSAPFRLLKLFKIQYGMTRTFADTDIDAAHIYESVDPISDSLSVNTLEFSTRTHTPEFSPITGNIQDDMLMKRQIMTVTADGRPFGTFFLDQWKDRHNSGTVFDFSAIDAIGVMGNYRFMGGIYRNVLASDIIGQLIKLCFPTGVVEYRIDSSLINARISGHIPICTAREALQFICFGVGMVCNATRTNVLRFSKSETKLELDSSFHASEKQSWSNVDRLRFLDGIPSVMTLEHNQVLLDGNMDEFPVEPSERRWGWWSANMSDLNGMFDSPPKLTIAFGTYHMAGKFVLRFDETRNEFAKSFSVKWVNDSQTIKTKSFSCNSPVFEVDGGSLTEYNRIDIEFLATNIPFRFIKLGSVVFGQTFDIPLDKIYRDGGLIEPTEYFNGIDLVAYDYQESDELINIWDKTLSAGEHVFEFSEPLHDLTISGGTIINSTANHVTVSVPDFGVVLIEGKRYIENVSTHSTRVDVAEGQQNNICVFDGCKLINNANAGQIIDTLWQYISQRTLIENDVRLDDLEVGNIAKMDTRHRSVIGTIEKLDISLRGGRAKTRVVGNIAVD